MQVHLHNIPQISIAVFTAANLKQIEKSKNLKAWREGVWIVIEFEIELKV